MTSIINTDIESWVNSIKIELADSEEFSQVKKILSGPLPDSLSVMATELPKSAFVKQIIARASAQLDIMLASLGLKKRCIKIARFHLLNEIDYELFTGNETDACTILGHSYIKKTEDKADFAITLSYELARLASFLELYVYQENNYLQYRCRRYGYEFHKTNRTILFKGLNIAGTEIIARIIRDMMCRSGLLNKDEIKHVIENNVHWSHLFLIDNLNKLLSEQLGIKESEIQMMIVRDIINGSLNYPRAINTIAPGSIALLKSMGEKPYMPAIFAGGIGLSNLKEEIEESLFE